MNGAVAAGHRLTAETGAQVLANGGNAVDACIAAAAVAWVAESPLTGPGAGGFMLVHRARDGADLLLDFFVEVPGRGPGGRAGGELETVDVPFGSGDTTQRFHIGPASCAVPGMVAGLAEAHRRFGTVSWEELLAPAIELATRGVIVTESQAFLHDILDAVLRREPAGREVYGLEGRMQAGECLVMQDLARTLELLAADGAATFYRGELGTAITSTLRDRGGLVTGADLAAYRVIGRRPVRVPYRGHVFVSNPPPSSGGVLIAFVLRLLDRLGPGGPSGRTEAILRLAETAREASRLRASQHVGRRLLADERIDEALARIRASAIASIEAHGLPSTTHVSVVDARGNAASLSSSTGCGSGVIVPGTGIQLNNMLGEMDLNPSGRPLRPGRRLTSMMAPSLLLRDGRPRLVLGSAGSERLRGAIVQTVVNVVDHGLDLRDAIDRPRAHLDGDDLHLEAGTAAPAAARLTELGYRVVRWPGTEPNLYFGGVAAVGVAATGRLEAAGDPRRGGHGVVVG